MIRSPALSSPPLHFNISLRQSEHTFKKNYLSLSEVTLMNVDGFMIINKISETEFYGHTETVKNHSLLWKIVYVKNDGRNFKRECSSEKSGCRRQNLKNQLWLLSALNLLPAEDFMGRFLELGRSQEV